MTVAKYSGLIWTLTSASSPGSHNRLAASFTKPYQYIRASGHRKRNETLDSASLSLTSYLRTERVFRAKCGQDRPRLSPLHRRAPSQARCAEPGPDLSWARAEHASAVLPSGVNARRRHFLRPSRV